MIKLFYQAGCACHQIYLEMATELTKLNGLRNQPSFHLALLSVTNFTVDSNKFITGSAILTYFLPILRCHDHNWERSQFNDISPTGKLYKTSSITIFTIIFCTLPISSTSITYTIKFTNVHHCCVLQDLSSVDWSELFRPVKNWWRYGRNYCLLKRAVSQLPLKFFFFLRAAVISSSY